MRDNNGDYTIIVFTTHRGYNHRICNHGALLLTERIQSYIDEVCFRWNTTKMDESERFAHMFETSIGLVKPNKDYVLCEVA